MKLQSLFVEAIQCKLICTCVIICDTSTLQEDWDFTRVTSKRYADLPTGPEAALRGISINPK